MFDSVEVAVTLSIRHNKPLLVVISSGSEQDASVGQVGQWSHELAKQVLAAKGNFGTIPLAIKQGTREFDNFVEIFPVNKVPCIYLLQRESVLCKWEDPVTSDLFTARLQEVLHGAGAGAETATGTEAETATSASSTPVAEDGNNSQAHFSSSSTGEDSSTVQTFETRPSETDGDVPSDSNAKNKAESRPTSKVDEKSNKRSAKEDSKADAVRTHAQNVFLQKKRDLEERKRVLRLVQNDRQELKTRADRERARRDSQNAVQAEKPLNLENTDESPININPGTSSAILVRLFDGTALKKRFKADDTLLTVRKWIEENRQGSDEPFTFYQNIPKRWFDLKEEEETLKSLELVPSASLILKRVSNVATAYSQQASWLSVKGIADAAYTFLGIGYRPQSRNDDDDSDDDEPVGYSGYSTPIVASGSKESSLEPEPEEDPRQTIRLRTPSTTQGDDTS